MFFKIIGTLVFFWKSTGEKIITTYPAQPDDRQWVTELSFKFVFCRMVLLTES